jgi:hypothetical protein
MPKYPVPSERGYSVIPLDRSTQKPLKSIHISQFEEALNVDLTFEDDTSLELIFRVGFSMSVTHLEYKDGDSRVIKRGKPRVHQ